MPYIMAYDNFPLDSLDEKRRFLTEAIDNNYTLWFYHDAYTLRAKAGQKGASFTVGEVLEKPPQLTL